MARFRCHKWLEIVRPNSDAELADYYRSVDILVAPGTVQHGAPHYPVLEAGACGTIVVTTGYLGATEETAWLVSNRSAESIVTAVESIIGKMLLENQRRYDPNEMTPLLQGNAYDVVQLLRGPPL